MSLSIHGLNVGVTRENVVVGKLREKNAADHFITDRVS